MKNSPRPPQSKSKAPPRKSADPTTKGGKRAALIWNDPTVPTHVRDAYRPVISPEGESVLPSADRQALENDRQKKIQQALANEETKFRHEADKSIAYDTGLADATEVLGPTAVVGQKVIDGGKKGHVNAYGSKEAIAQRHASYAEFVVLLRQSDSRLSLSEIFRRGAKNFDMKPRTIERAYRKK